MYKKMNLNVSIVDFLNGEKIKGIPNKKFNLSKVRVTIDYPLTNPAHFEFTSEVGFSLKGIISIICEAYSEIYREEKRTSPKPEGRIPGMMNRSKTDGNYGIWGHDLGDLCIEGISIEQDGSIELCVGS